MGIGPRFRGLATAFNQLLMNSQKAETLTIRRCKVCPV